MQKYWVHEVPPDDIWIHLIRGINCECNPKVNGVEKSITHYPMDGRDKVSLYILYREMLKKIP